MTVSTILNAPDDTLRQWDDWACETACTAQLLHIYGLLPRPFDPAWLDARVGREPGEPDRANGNVRVLLEEGLTITQIDRTDLDLIATDMSYVRQLWIEEGDDPRDVDETLPRWYPDIRARALVKLDLIARFPGQFIRVKRRSSMVDISDFLRQGFVVGCFTHNSSGSGHCILVLSEDAEEPDSAFYEIYDPKYGIIPIMRDDLINEVLPGIEAYQRGLP